jgi:hypothetical protein
MRGVVSHAITIPRRIGHRIESLLPHGWGEFALQALIFWSFYVAYEGARALASGDRYVAIENALDVLRAQQELGIAWERQIQDWAINAPGIVMAVANWTYFNCHFIVSYGLLLFIYFRRNHAFYFVRNVILATSFAALIGYLLLPTAPPRMLAGLGFIDTLQQTAVNHDSDIVAAFSNPYAAMPSLHTAYAVIIGAAGILVFANPLLRAIWAAYPFLVLFSIITTANHWFLDAAVGSLLALLAMILAFAIARGRIPTLTRYHEQRRLYPTTPAPSRLEHEPRAPALRR